MLVIVLPAYKLYVSIKKLTKRFYAPHKSRHRFIHPFSRRYLTHGIIVTVSIFTITANLNAYEIRRDQFDQQSIFAAIVSAEEIGALEEEGPIPSTKKVTRYLGTTGVEAQQPRASEGEQSELLLPSTVAGSSAVVSPILSPVEEALRQRDQVAYYTVQPGDTISEIAERFGITSNTILWENNLTAYSLIRPGDTLAILPTSGINHKVERGESINSIANKYGIEAEKIIEFNKLASADDIKIGERLLIPGGKKITPTPSYTVRSFTQPVVAPPPPRVIAASGEMIWPTSCRRITQYFRYLHSGVDIACSYGAPIYAADDGQVLESQAGWNGGYGTMILIDHGNGKQTLYGHMASLYVKAGENVTKGQTIGAMGSTGRSTGAHVHFEVRSGATRQNPLHYVQ